MEKHNNSNNPSETQPIKEDGTFTFKNEFHGKKYSVKENYKGAYNKLASDIAKEIYQGATDDEIEKKVKDFIDNPSLLLKVLEDTNDYSSLDLVQFFMLDKSDVESEDIDLDGLEEQEVSEEWDEDLSGLEEFGSSEEWEDEKKPKLEGKKEEVFNACGSTFGLSEKKLADATDEQIDKLESAIDNSTTAKIALKESEKKVEEAKKELEIAQQQQYSVGKSHPLYGVFKDKTIYESDYEQYKYKLAAKKDYYQQILDSEASTDSQKAFAQTKLGEIADYEKASEIFDAKDSEEIEKKIFDLSTEIQKELDSQKEFKKKIEENQSYINSFVDEDDPYSDFRRKNAISFGYNDPSSLAQGSFASALKKSKEFLIPIAEKQREQMTSEEQAFLKYYTHSFNWCNEPLRGISYAGYNMPKYNQSTGNISTGGQSAKKDFENGVNAMTNAISKCKLPQDMWFQRGTDDLDIGFVKSLVGYVYKNGTDSVVGLEFRHKNFASMGSSKGAGFSGLVMMNVYCPKGTECHYLEGLSYYSGGSENEMLLNRGYSMKIRKCEEKHGKIYLDVDVILGSNSKEVLDKDMEYALNYV